MRRKLTQDLIISRVVKRRKFVIKNLYTTVRSDLVSDLNKNIQNKNSLLKEIISHLNEKFEYSNIFFDKNELILMQDLNIPALLRKMGSSVDSLAKSFAYKQIRWD